MILVDANLLLYAHDTRSDHQDEARRWLEKAFGEEVDVRLPLVTLLAFIRIGSDPRLYAQPLSMEEATAIVRGWLARSNVAIATPGDRHWAILGDIAQAGQARGPVAMDAHLAALTIEHGAELMTTDRGFARFPGLRFRNPLPGSGPRGT